MLKERIITALILVPIVIWCVFFAQGTHAFAAFAGAIVLVGAWEWTALMAWQQPIARALFTGVVAIGLVAMSLPHLKHLQPVLYAVSVGFWLIAVRAVIFYPESARFWAKTPILVPSGLILLIPAWTALCYLHQESPLWLMYVFVLVWGADTGAYFAGRRFGKHKLAPKVSPGKTVEGFIGGVILTTMIIVAVAISRDLNAMKFAAFVGLSLLTVLASVMGDLLESMVKRQAGVKDSGNIFPGHGGALDRIDSLTAAAPLFALGWWVAGGF
ncbi:phosphatidate cytidylyltransferase [Agitococcus lubricus]|uniref:Phosphatidate cytidylyltransferase n=1 Tax=Agitococcus lubricus TaxID=1077255 RepID=A0A2T5J1I9_9GAMM|nr:phosphatidate cytidylyltransferase [Agitococcus lubricus]PTQ90311.1 phosphatidate cytidylyltransferase [Agitococcus lubricus]